MEFPFDLFNYEIMIIISKLYCCRYFTSLDSDCFASSHCSASGLFRFQYLTVTVLVILRHLVSYIFFGFSNAASIHVFPGQWQGCRNETRGCKIDHDGSSVMRRLCDEDGTWELRGDLSKFR